MKKKIKLKKIKESSYYKNKISKLRSEQMPIFLNLVELAQNVLNDTKFEVYLKPNLGNWCDFILTTRTIEDKVLRKLVTNEIIQFVVNEKREQNSPENSYILTNFIKMFQKQMKAKTNESKKISVEGNDYSKETLKIINDALSNNIENYTLEFSKSFTKNRGL